MRLFGALGSIHAFVAVAMGAFGAHALKARLSPERLSVFEVGARYHLFHALGLFAAALLVDRGAPAATAGGWSMFAGIVLFSGSLYALALTGARGFGAVTPVGGLLFLTSWALLAWAALHLPR
jgi:uncharacterized membrane protein YgdD (TMEM256/DUF423 family)